MSDFKRADRVGAQIHGALARILQEGLRDPRLAMVSITSVRVSDDLRVASVRVLPLGGGGDREAMLEGLDRAKGYLRRQLGRRVKARYVPELRFYIDEELESSVEMVSMLSRMEAERAQAEAASSQEGEE